MGSTSTRSPARRLMKIMGIVALVFVLAIGGGAFYSWRLAGQAPLWWQPVDPADPQVDRAARGIENGISDQLHRARPTPTDGAAPATWTLVIKQADANAWLGSRLANWLANRNERLAWPSNASWPQIAFEPDQLVMGFEIQESGRSRVVSTTLIPAIDANGALWLKLESIAIGRFGLPVPENAGPVLEGRLPPDLRTNPDTQNFIAALTGARPLMDQAVMKLSDGRKVQMLRLTPKAGELEIECRTMPR